MPFFKSLILSLMLVVSNQAWSQAKVVFQVETLATGLGVIWAMEFLDEHTLIFTVRSGRVGIMDSETQDVRWLSGLPPIHTQGQGGLLDVKASPNYLQDQWLYFTYSHPLANSAVTALARAQLDGDKLVNWQDLILTQSSSNSHQHWGSRIAFDHQGHVFFGIGDRGIRDESQNTLSHTGSILRLTLDGDIPQDNPFVNNPDVLDEIWSFGHRNPQGMAFDSARQQLWSNEHGPRGGDEINLIERGQNYGWPEVSQGKEYWGPVAIGATHKDGMIDPIKVFTPSIAPGSLLVYSGRAFPQWQGHFFSGALALRHLNRVVIDQQYKAVEEERLLEELNERIRALAEDTAGRIYFSTDSGQIKRLVPKSDSR